VIKLYQGNSREILKTLEDNSVSAIITDPLYDYKFPIEEIDQFKRICSGNIIMFCAPENEFFVPDERAYWIKTPSTKNYSKHLGRFVEHILIMRRGNTFNNGLHWSNYTGVYDDKLLTQIHPFEKPISLLERLIAIYTDQGDTVLDPFMGSGSVGVSCARLNRNFIGVEIDKDYFEIANTRITNANK
jgi:DNA modification methylase